ncbi:MAG: LD-carboxypeptidase [Odoribacter sp.]|nr:LD-carboxypeptidase [Odoribacter sp.]
MLRPPYLQVGDKVALISPASAIDASYVTHAAKVLESWGLLPLVGVNALNRHGDFAGTDEERLADIQWAMDEEEIKAIFCTRGGYGTIRIVEKIDYSRLQGNPKWIVGFSDITVLHTKLTAIGIESLHAPMAKNFKDITIQSLNYLKDFLFGTIYKYTLPHNPLNRSGIVRSELTGGNLCTLNSIRSSVIEHRPNGKVLFIEDVGENLYTVDRLMQSFKLSGRLALLGGLIVGGFSDMKGENFGKTAYEIIREAVDEYIYPVYFGFPAGHISNNLPLIMGASIELCVDEETTEITFI